MTPARTSDVDMDVSELEFDLRDLAFPAPGADGGGLPMPQDDPFRALGIAGIEAPSPRDALAALLGESAPPPADRAPGRRRPPPDTADALPIDAGPEPHGAALLLERLHDEFMRVVRDPIRLAGQDDWEGTPARGGAPAPTLDDLGQQAASSAQLLDIVRARRPIDEVLETFDPLGQAPSLDVPARPDVLHLFAPETVRHVRPPLPGLTLREHHAVSPDSPMPRVAPGIGGEGTA